VILEEGLLAFLQSIPELTDIVARNIYGLMRPQGGVTQLPAIVFQRTSTTRQELFCGVCPLVNADFQIDSYAMDSSAFDLAHAVRETLKNFSGTMGEITVQKVFLTNEFPANDPDPGVIRMTQLFNFWYVED
jgi:hypothetical protein